MSQKRVLLLCGDHMEDLAAMIPFQALQAYGVAVDAVCPGKNAGEFCCTEVCQNSSRQTYSETRGHNFLLNATFYGVDVKSYDGLLLPSGRASKYLAQDPEVVNLVTEFASSGKSMASIGEGQLILSAAGAAKGRFCTALSSIRPALVASGAKWVEPITASATVMDGNLITAATYNGFPDYILRFVRALGGNISGADKRILFLCGDFMEDYEVVVPFYSLWALGCKVDAVCPKKTVSDSCPTVIHDSEGHQTYSEKPGHVFILNYDYDFVDTSDYDALVIPGGRAPIYLALDESVVTLVKDFMEKKKPVASICQGQQILAAADVLKGRKCTAHPDVKLTVVLAGATWLEPDPIHRCFTDGNLVTGSAWQEHPEFISQLMDLIGIHVSF